jgi:hypothetical protein
VVRSWDINGTDQYDATHECENHLQEKKDQAGTRTQTKLKTEMPSDGQGLTVITNAK